MTPLAPEGGSMRRTGGGECEDSITCFRFRHAADNQGHEWTGTWPQLAEDLLRRHRPAPGWGHDPKLGSPAFSPFAFDGPRSGDNATRSGIIAFDFDNATRRWTGAYHPGSNGPVMEKVRLENPVRVEQVRERLSGLAHAAYESYSCTPEHPKFRVVLPLAAPVDASDWDVFTEGAIAALGFEDLREAIDISALRDPARIYFLMTKDGRSWAGDGLPLAVDPGLVPKVLPASPAPPWASPSHEKGYAWAKRFVDRTGKPLDLTRLDGRKLCESLGMRLGRERLLSGGGRKWRTSCPWASEHSGGRDSDDSVLIEAPGQWPRWKCSHDGHSELGIQDLLKLAGMLR